MRRFFHNSSLRQAQASTRQTTRDAAKINW